MPRQVIFSMHHMKKLFPLLILLNLSVEITRSQTSSRLIAFAVYGTDTTTAPVDTGGYNSYSFGRGAGILYSLDSSIGNIYPFDYTPAADYVTGHHGITKFDSAWHGRYANNVISTQSFDGNDNIISAASFKIVSGVWQKIRSTSYSYDINNNLLVETDSNWTTTSASTQNQFIYTYDATNHLLSKFSNYSDTARWLLITHTYDGSGRLWVDSTFDWNLATNSWHNREAFQYYYHGLRPDSFLFYVGYFLYDSGNIYFSPTTDTVILNDYYALAANRLMNVFDSHHNKILAQSDDFLPLFDPYQVKAEWQYNSYNQVTSERIYSKDFTGQWQFASLRKYYYENYDPASIRPLKQLPNAELQLAPSPTNSELAIKLEWSFSQLFSITIYDVSGRNVISWDEPSTKKYEKTVSVRNLPAGDYLLCVIGAKQKIVRKFTVIH
jgi:Secretion system C-terminal sorting domain